MYFTQEIFMEFVGILRGITFTECLEKRLEILSVGLNA
jgi:hypothetical protein